MTVLEGLGEVAAVLLRVGGEHSTRAELRPPMRGKCHYPRRLASGRAASDSPIAVLDNRRKRAQPGASGSHRLHTQSRPWRAGAAAKPCVPGRPIPAIGMSRPRARASPPAPRRNQGSGSRIPSRPAAYAVPVRTLGSRGWAGPRRESGSQRLKRRHRHGQRDYDSYECSPGLRSRPGRIGFARHSRPPAKP